VRDAVASGELGFVHTVRAATMDQTPPPAAYLATSGGIFRDCNVHDFDILRFVTGREVTRVFATGANKGEEFFTEAGDVDTAAATLVLDDGTLAVVTSTRYNGAGHDVRMEVHGSKGTLGVGHDTALAISSAEPGIEWPPGPRHWSFMERFLPAYVTELTAFVEVARGAAPSPCTVADALEAFRTAEACARSLSSGAPVDLVDIPTVRSDLSVRG
jgi:myo-inositol 2-dehydrogenase / D-chiro-inositol 1-dehydrogenase